jgi:hypothetical protein
MNFGYYSDNAQVAVDQIKVRNGINLEKTVLDKAYNRTSLKWFHRFKRGRKEDLEENPRITFFRSMKSLLLFPSYLALIGVLPFLAINEIGSFLQVMEFVVAIYVTYVVAVLAMKRMRKPNRKS